MSKIKLRFIYILIFFIGFGISFFKLIPGCPKWVGTMGLCIAIIGIMLFTYTFDFSRHKKMQRVSFDIQAKSKESIIEDYHLNGIFQYYEVLLKLFYNKNNTKRILFIKRNETQVGVIKEKLTIFNKDELSYCSDYAFWEDDRSPNSFYADLDLALSDNEAELRSFHEESKESIYSNNNDIYFAEIIWIAEVDGGRKSIPFGSKYAPQILIKGETEIKWSAFVFNQYAIRSYQTYAVIYYLSDEAPDNLVKNIEFDVYEGSRKVASGIIVDKLSI